VYSGNLSIAASHARGNTDSERAHLDASVRARARDSRYDRFYRPAQLYETPETHLSLKAGIDHVFLDSIPEAHDSYLAADRARERGHPQPDRAARADREGLNLNAQLNLDWESEPAPGRKGTDSVWVLGVGYVW
jgi:hypothetical protein